MNLIKNKEGAAQTLLRPAAIVAGLGLLVMTVFAVIPDSLIFKKLILPEDPTGTATNILANERLFRLGICSYLIVIICDVLVAWGLYIFLKPTNRNLSLLMAWFRLIYAAIFGISLTNYLTALQLLTGPEFLTAFETNYLNAQILLSLNAFTEGWAIGFIFFGFHLIILGYLVFKSGYIPKVLGILLILTGVGYLIYNFGKFLFPAYDLKLATMIGWGELLFAFWLLLKGVKLNLSDKLDGFEKS